MFFLDSRFGIRVVLGMCRPATLDVVHKPACHIGMRALGAEATRPRAFFSLLVGGLTLPETNTVD